MKTLLERQRPFDSTEQIVSAEFIKLIRKLHWIGMEDEAKRIQTQLALCRVPPSESVLAAPHDTD
jgi:hypothetical protein